MINKNQNVNFGIRITISKKAYEDKPVEKLLEIGKSVDIPWTLNEAKFTRDEIVTKEIMQCTT